MKNNNKLLFAIGAFLFLLFFYLIFKTAVTVNPEVRIVNTTYQKIPIKRKGTIVVPVAKVKDVRPGYMYGTIEIFPDQLTDLQGNTVPAGDYLFVNPAALPVDTSTEVDEPGHIAMFEKDMFGVRIKCFMLKYSGN